MAECKNDESKRVGLSRIAMGECYLTALKVILERRDELGGDVILTDPPANMLAGFALELLLKGYILLKGETPKRARGFGHKIDQLVIEATKRGLPTIVGLSELTKTLGKGHADFTYRYIEAGDLSAVFAWDLVLPIFDRLFVPIRETIDQR